MGNLLVARHEAANPQVAVVGVGHLGSRYVQGLLAISQPLDIWLKDPSIVSESTFEKWKSNHSINVCHHTVEFDDNLKELPEHFDLIVSATTADVRYESMESFLKGRTFDYLILEKILTTGLADLKKLTALVDRGTGCWVNHPMRLSPLYQQLKIEIEDSGPLRFTVRGSDWGLATSSSHYCDLVRWVTNEKLVDFDVSLIDSVWPDSKRQGFYELTGELKYKFSDGSELILESRPQTVENSHPTFLMHVESSRGEAFIDELGGTAQGSMLSVDLEGKSALQSELTPNLVSKILNFGKCDLPKFDDVCADHAMFLTSLLEYQRRVHGNSSEIVRIT